MGFLSLLPPQPPGSSECFIWTQPLATNSPGRQSPPSAGQYHITPQGAQPPGMPLVVVPEETAWGLLARAGARAGMHTGGSVAHITASSTGFLNHSNGSFIICIIGDSCSYFITIIETELCLHSKILKEITFKVYHNTISLLYSI